MLAGKLEHPDFRHQLALLGVQSFGVLICQLKISISRCIIFLLLELVKIRHTYHKQPSSYNDKRYAFRK